MTDDGFIDLAPPGKTAPRVANVILSTFKIRGNPRLGLSIDPGFFGAERVIVAWNAETFTLRLRPDERGTFDLRRGPGRASKRVILRLELPDGLQVVERKEPGPCKVEGGTLFITIPPPMRRPLSQAQAVDRARQLVPAPNFSGPGAKR